MTKKPLSPKLSRDPNRLYQADAGLADHIAKVRDTLIPLCHQYRNHAVRVETIDGRSFEGVIVEIDAGHLYLQVSRQNRAFFPSPFTPFPSPYPFFPQQQYYYNNVILPLVLFELLTIALI